MQVVEARLRIIGSITVETLNFSSFFHDFSLAQELMELILFSKNHLEKSPEKNIENYEQNEKDEKETEIAN